MSLTISYLSKRPDNYEQLEKELKEKTEIGFRLFPDAEVFANWKDGSWSIVSRPVDFWIHCVADMNRKEGK